MENKVERLKAEKINLLIVLFVFISFRAFAQPRELYPILFDYARELYPEYKNIPEDRRYRLEAVAEYLKNARTYAMEPEVLFVGTNQATRSIMAQAWAQAAAHYYGFDAGKYFSGGIHEGPVSTNAIRALEKAGFIVYKIKEGGKVFYQVKYSYDLKPIVIYPKKIDNRLNPVKNFMAVVVCPNAAQNLPVIKGTYSKIEVLYEDPLGYDETGYADEKYDEICHQIAVEMFYLFSQLKHV